MKREILFRGRKKGSIEWAHGYLAAYDLISPRYPEDVSNALGEYYNETPYVGFVEVDPDTVGQYTGLIDKNGKEIFKGDIVEFFCMRGEIVSECGSFGIGCRNPIDYDLLDRKIPSNNSAHFCYNDNFISLWELWWNYEQDDNPLYEVEVIGNRWDNPELLEVKA